MGMMPESIYLDSCWVIYFVEQHPRFGPVINQGIESHLGMLFPD